MDSIKRRNEVIGYPELEYRYLFHPPISHNPELGLSRISVRRFRPADINAVLAIERSCFGPDAWPRELFLDYALHCPDVFLVAAGHGRLAGYSIACINRDSVELASIAVSPRFRGRGIATRLIRRSSTVAAARGARSMWLMVRTANLGAIQLYRKLGFVRVRTVAGYYEDGASAWRMRRDKLFL